MSYLPYGRHLVDQEDISAVTDVLRSEWLTTGPMVERFEKAVASFAGASHAVALSNGTAALHAAMASLGITQGDEVVVPSITFVATANAVVMQGGTPVLADVLPSSLLVDPDDVARKITPRTKAIVAVDYAGQPCDYDLLQSIADDHGLALVADACHSLGAEYKGRPVGDLADLVALSFHPVKGITTGEGGMVLTQSEERAARMKTFRNHGISSDHHMRTARNSWIYEMVSLGYNYRLSDIHCALGISQLKKLPQWLERRREIARIYDGAIGEIKGFKALQSAPHVLHAYHLYVVLVDDPPGRDATFRHLRNRGIGVNVHYIPVNLHPYYREHFPMGPGQHPVAESSYEQLLSLPIWPGMRDADVERVLDELRRVPIGH